MQLKPYAEAMKNEKLEEAYDGHLGYAESKRSNSSKSIYLLDTIHTIMKKKLLLREIVSNSFF